MSAEKKVGTSVLRVIEGDVTNQEGDAFVYYAQPDLKLGSGFGGAISVRGGQSIQKELDELGPIDVTEVVISSAGKLKADFIVHAVGPRFQEEDIEGKLRATMKNVLKQAEEKGIKKIVFPAMGYGFYGVPLDLCAQVTLEVAKKHLEGSSRFQEVIFCLRDGNQYRAFKKKLERLN